MIRPPLEFPHDGATSRGQHSKHYLDKDGNVTVGEDSAEERLTRAEAKARTRERRLDEAAQSASRAAGLLRCLRFSGL